MSLLAAHATAYRALSVAFLDRATFLEDNGGNREQAELLRQIGFVHQRAAEGIEADIKAEMTSFHEAVDINREIHEA